MIDKTNVIAAVLERLEKLPLGHYLDMRTYKRNRKIFFVRQAEDSFLVLQDGFEQARFEDVSLGKMKKLLQTLLKKEFPRSAKVRLYVMGEFDPDESPNIRRKEL